MHKVKCTVCGEVFDRDKTQAVKTGARRYAHLRCCPNGEKVEMGSPIDSDLAQLEEYVKKLFKEDFVSAKIRGQIKKFKEEYGYSYSGILKSLVYFYEVKNNSLEKSGGGIGIVPFVYKDAYNYYLDLFLANQKNENKNITLSMKIKEVIIKTPEARQPRKKLFNLDDDEEET